MLGNGSDELIDILLGGLQRAGRHVCWRRCRAS
jgi:hypothetical protein